MTASELAGKRIAIVRLSAIGDVVHVLPIVSSIRAAAPDAHITWIIQPTPHELVQHHPGVDEFILFERKPLLRSYQRLRLATRGRKFDLVLAPHTSLKAGLATSMLNSPRKIGFDRARAPELNWLFTNERVPARPRAHMQDEMIEFVEHLGIPLRLEWGIEPTKAEVTRYESLLPGFGGPTVALSIASSLRDKDWPAERFAALADRITAQLGARTIIVGGRSDVEMAAVATVQRLASTPPLDLGAWDLRRLVYLVSRSDVVVSPDSGPLHIAVALGTPSVALMGHTNPKRVGPYRFRELMVDAYGEPGERYGASAGPRKGRMERIGVDAVVEKVGQALTPPLYSLPPPV
ncbi:MAG: glycosyltransferase family 9 protein [Gemmatimonadota bacterium]